MLERFRIFLLASGLRRSGRRHVAEAVVANHDWTYAIVTEAAASAIRVSPTLLVVCARAAGATGAGRGLPHQTLAGYRG